MKHFKVSVFYQDDAHHFYYVDFPSKEDVIKALRKEKKTCTQEYWSIFYEPIIQGLKSFKEFPKEFTRSRYTKTLTLKINGSWKYPFLVIETFEFEDWKNDARLREANHE